MSGDTSVIPWDLAEAKRLYLAGSTLAAIGARFGAIQSSVFNRFRLQWPDRPRRKHVYYATEEERIAARRASYRRAHIKKRSSLTAEQMEEARAFSRMRNWKYRQGEAYSAGAQKRCETFKSYSRNLRLAAVAHYGGRCACCGESNVCFLTIDHTHNDGASHRKETGSGSAFYQWLKKNNYPDDGRFQVMCFNCNFAKAMDPVGHRLAHPHAKDVDGLGDNPQPVRTTKYKIPTEG